MTARYKAVELHCHLDGCVRPTTIEQLAHEQRIDLPGPAARLATVSPGCQSLVDYISAIDIALDVLQTPEALWRAAYELTEQWQVDGVLHGEARFAPELHTRRGLALSEIVEAVSAGLSAGSQATQVHHSLILSCMRPSPPEISWKVIEEALACEGVIGVDVAGPEKGVALLPHAPAFQAARAANLRVTVHAGEADSATGVWQAIDELGAERIGHGVTSIHDSALVERLANDSITLEQCPSSNLQTTAVANIAEHPIESFRSAGVRISLSTDCRTTSGVTLESEYCLLREQFSWDTAVWNEVQSSACAAAFIPEPRVGRLRQRFYEEIHSQD
ncbi:adenosine deaminase [Pseudonocardia sp. NPDC046786]|uniref:adenosine deaminase n=1 Tax=Pseudonocardia sp. NPDC046786 TaxID=3155471 RepID=UPI0033DF6D9C